MNLYKRKVKFFFTVACLIPQFMVAELSFTKIKHLHTVVHPKFGYLSALVGFSWWRTHTIENMYRYGNDQDATIQLLKELFHLQVDGVTFDVTALSKKPAKYFNATIVGTIIGMLELYKDETAESFQAKLLAEIKKDFDAIVAEAKKYTDGLENEKKALQKKVDAAQIKLQQNKVYTNLDQEIKNLNKKIKLQEQKLNPFRKTIRTKALEIKLPEDEIKKILKNLDVIQLAEKNLISSEEAEQIKPILDAIEQNNVAVKEKRMLMAQLEEDTGIVADKKKIKARELTLYKKQVDVKFLNTDLEKLVSLIAQAHAESLENRYVPHMPQIILSAFLWKKANAKDKSEFKEYYNQVAQIAHIPLVNEYPPDWNSEYTFQEYESLKTQIGDAVGSDNIESFLTGQGYEQLTFAFAGYQFWDQPFPAFITSIETTYDFKGTKYDFSNCVEASILNFIIAMLANDTKTTIDLDLLNNTIAKQKDVVINQKMLDFLTTHQNLAPMQTRRNQDAWNQVVQSLAGVIYWQPNTETAESGNRFYEIEPGVRNVLKIFNHLFFGNSPDFDALSVEEQLNRLCSIFNRPEFTVTWSIENENVDIVNIVDVSKTPYPSINTIKELVINFEVEKGKSATFQWNLMPGHSFIPPAGAESRWSVEKTIGLVLQNKLDETALLSLFSWVAGSIMLPDIFEQIKKANLPLAYTIAVTFMQNLASNEHKLEIIKNILSVSQDSAVIPTIQKLMTTLPDDPAYNDELYIIAHNYNLESLYKDLKSNISNKNEIFSKAIEYGYLPFIKKEIDNGFDINSGNRTLTPLHFAAMYGKKDIAELLLNNGATVDARNDYQETPLYYAIRNNKGDIAEFLIEHGADVNAQDSSKDTPLHIAARKNNKEIVELLLNNGAQVNAQNRLQFTPLHDAASGHKNQHIVRLLLNKGAEINAKNSEEDTPLLIAAFKGYKDIVELLIASGANVTIKDGFGFTPKDRARMQGFDDIVALFDKN